MDICTNIKRNMLLITITWETIASNFICIFVQNCFVSQQIAI